MSRRGGERRGQDRGARRGKGGTGKGGKRGGKGGKRGGKRAAATAKATRVYSHPLYGDIPMVPAEIEVAPGKVHRFEDYDPDYQPPMPRGAVRGDVRNQVFCRMCHVPRYFYVDEDKRCVQCGGSFVFSAGEQKYWYETLKFHFDSVAIRCPVCRRRQRSDRALNAQLAAILQKLADNPDDPSSLMALAQTTVELRERTGRGNLERALAAARKAARLWPDYAPALYWQARCQEAAGRTGKAVDLYAQFCALPGADKHKAELRRAQERVAGR